MLVTARCSKVSPSTTVTPPGVSARSASTPFFSARTSTLPRVATWGSASSEGGSPAKAVTGQDSAARTASDRHDERIAVREGRDMLAPKHKNATRRSRGKAWLVVQSVSGGSLCAESAQVARRAWRMGAAPEQGCDGRQCQQPAQQQQQQRQRRHQAAIAAGITGFVRMRRWVFIATEARDIAAQQRCDQGGSAGPRWYTSAVRAAPRHWHPASWPANG
jgi:hypothetical protein